MLLGCLFCAAEGNFVRVYCYCVQDWWTTDGAAIGFYVYGDGDAINAAWPGELMQQVDGQEGLWTAEVDNSVYSSLIFTRVSPEGAEWGAQTANLTIPTDSMNVYRITSVSGVWSPESVEGYWTSLSQINTGSVVEDEANYYLIGSTEELGSWDLANALPMEGGAISLELSEGSYTFKVLPQRDSWDNVLGYSNLSHGCSSAGVRGDGDENISITMSEAGMITVSVTDNIICVTGNFINTGNSVYLTTGVTPTNCGGYAYPLSGEYTIGASVELEANISIGGWMFDKWSDNESWDNPRTITLTQDTTITAIFSPGEYGILVNGNRLYRGTFTERLEGSYVAQFLANVRMNEGDYFQIINLFHSDNTRWSPQLEEGGLSGNFTAQDGSIRCNTTGCYDMYIKIHYGQSDDYVYIGGGSDCPEGEEVDFGGGTSANRVYSLVGTDNLFATAWDIGDSLTEMTLVGDGMYQYTIDSVTLIPEGDYQYKVIANHAWNIEEYPSVQEDDNYHITVEQSGVYMVLFSFQPSVGCNATTMYLHEINNDAPEIVASGYCAEDGTMSVSWLLSSDSILTIGGNGAMADYNEETVIAPWYEYRDAYHSVYIAAGVTNVGNLAFQQSANLRYVDLASTVTSLGNYSFYNCPALHALTLPESVTTVGDNTPFGGSTTITSAVYNSQVFVRLPQDYTGEYTVEEGTTVIASDAFKRCNMLSSVVLPSTVTTFAGSSTFEECSALATVNIPEGVTSLGFYMFSGCSSLRYIELPSSVASLGSYCFGECSSVESVICRSTTPPEANGSTFAGVSDTVPVYVPSASLARYREADGWSSFSNYHGINDDPQSCVIASGECGANGDNLTWSLSCDSVLTISGEGEMPSSYSSNATPWYSYGQAIKHINIEEGVTKLALNSFYNSGSSANYPNVRTLSIPSTLGAPIETSYFYGCPLTSVTINSDTIVGQASYTSGSSLQNKFGAQVEEYIIGGSVRSIANFAFRNQSDDSLRTIILPEGLETIGNWAFGYIEHLTSVSIPSTVQTIGTDAFAGCTNLRSVELGEGLMTINGQAFYMCDNLTHVTCNALTPPALNSTAFDHYDTLFVPCEAKNTYMEAESWKNFSPILCPDDTIDGYTEPDAPEQITMALDSSWKFIMLPTILGLQADNIVVDGEIAWAVYNGEERAAGRSGWQGFNPINGFTDIQACIVRARNGSATLTLNLPEQVRERASAELSANYFPAAHEQNANWNFLGNPYPFRYDIMSALENANISSPIAVWNGIAYDFYTPGLDEYVLQPFESFFIQLPANGPTSIPFSAEYTLGD